MTKKSRFTWVQIMALIALFGIILGVIGGAWATLPTTSTSTSTSSADTNG